MKYRIARWLAARLIEPFRPKHERVKVFIGFEVKPAKWSDCPHCPMPKEALEAAEFEDAIEEGSHGSKGG